MSESPNGSRGKRPTTTMTGRHASSKVRSVFRWRHRRQPGRCADRPAVARCKRNAGPGGRGRLFGDRICGPLGNCWRVRYFSPETEVPFGGHATIARGAALTLAHGDGVFALDLLGYTSRDLDPSLAPARIHGGADHLFFAFNTHETLAAMRHDLAAGRSWMQDLGLVTIVLAGCLRDVSMAPWRTHRHRARGGHGHAIAPEAGHPTPGRSVHPRLGLCPSHVSESSRAIVASRRHRGTLPSGRRRP